MRQVFLAMLWLSTSAFASLLPHASAVMTHLICDSSQTLCHFLYSYSCYQIVAGRFTRWGDDPSRWLCSPPLFSLSIHSFLCFYLLVYLHVGICDFILCPSFLSLFIYLHLAFCDFTFWLCPDQLVSEAIFTHTSVFFAQFPLFICSK